MSAGGGDCVVCGQCVSSTRGGDCHCWPEARREGPEGMAGGAFCWLSSCVKSESALWSMLSTPLCCMFRRSSGGWLLGGCIKGWTFWYCQLFLRVGTCLFPACAGRHDRKGVLVLGPCSREFLLRCCCIHNMCGARVHLEGPSENWAWAVQPRGCEGA